ncbi:MAG: DUF3237 family protein [Chitinophagales bacterium]
MQTSQLQQEQKLYTLSRGNYKWKINGKFLPIGADFGTSLSPTNFKHDIREVIQTEDSATIYVTYTGYIHANAETFGLLVSGKTKEVSPNKYYFQINPIFETTSKNMTGLMILSLLVLEL